MKDFLNYFTIGFESLSWQHFVMYGLGILLIYLASV